ncbi:MAG: sporulation protein [Patescibacteria group bacterium]
MGFFDKIKGALNIGGVKIALTSAGSVQNGQNLEVTLALTGGTAPSNIKGVHISLAEQKSARQYGIGGNNSTNVQRTVLAQKDEPGGFTLGAGEQKTYSFSLPVQAAPGQADQAGVMGALGKLNAMATKEQRAWTLDASVEVEGSIGARTSSAIVVTF